MYKGVNHDNNNLHNALYEPATGQLETLNYELYVGEPRHDQDRKVTDIGGSSTVVRRDDLELFGILGHAGTGADGDKTTALLADAVMGQDEAHGAAPRSENGLADRIASLAAVARGANPEGQSTATLVKIEHIDGRLYLAWVNTGAPSQLLVQRHLGGEIVTLPASRPRKRLVNSLYSTETNDAHTHRTSGYFPLRGNERIVLCANGMAASKGAQAVNQMEMQSVFHVGHTQQAADRMAEISLDKNEKSTLVLDIYEKVETRLFPKGSARKHINAARAAVAETVASSSSKAANRVKTALGSLAVRKPARIKTPSQMEKRPTMRQKLHDVQASLFARVMDTPHAVKEYFTDEESGRRRKAIAAAAGAAALIGAAYATYKFGVSGGQSQAMSARENLDHDTLLNLSSPLPLESESSVKTEHHGLVPLSQSSGNHANITEATHATQRVPQLQLRHQGDGIWSTVKDYLHSKGYNESDNRVSKITNFIRAKRHISEEAARNLPQGWKFELPRWFNK